VYVFNSAFETRPESCLHSVGGLFLLVCTYFSLPEKRNKGNDSAFIKLIEEDLVLIDWVGLVYVPLVQMHHFYNKLVSIAYKFFENCVLFLLQHCCQHFNQLFSFQILYQVVTIFNLLLK